MKKIFTIVGLLLVPAVGRGSVQSQQPERPKIIGSLSTATVTGDVGILPITATRLQEAIALGQTEQPPIEAFTLPLAAFVKVRTMDAIVRDATLMERFKSYTSAPFKVSILSPYAAAVLQSSEAKRKYQPIPIIDLATLNAQKVVVHVYPGGTINTLDTIENVIVKRAGEVIRPSKVEVKPVVMQTNMGASRPSSEGRFTFDFSTFAPTTSITLVCIGQHGNWEWDMSAAELAVLR
jgi:hypothetical protein